MPERFFQISEVTSDGNPKSKSRCKILNMHSMLRLLSKWKVILGLCSLMGLAEVPDCSAFGQIEGEIS